MAKSRGRKFAEITSPTSGVFDLTSVPTITNAKLQNSAMTLAGSSVSLGGTGVANTDALSEGSSNLYFTDARVQTFLGGGTLAGNVVVPDNRSIYLGSNSDFRMVHNTTNTQLINATGALQITSNGGFDVTGAATFSSTITATGNITGTLATAAQPNITSVGTLSSLSVGAITSSGNLSVTGQGDFSTQVLVGNNNSHFSENNIRFQSAGAAYFDHNTTGQSFVFRTSNSSALDTTALIIDHLGNTTIRSGNKLILNRADNATGGEITYGPTGTGFIINDVNGDDTIFKTGSTEHMRIDAATSRVGIGISAPSSIFHVKTASGTHRSRFESGNSHSLIRLIAATGSNAGLEFYSGAGNVGNITADGSSNLLFEPGGAEKMRIQSGGNVLIGATTSSLPSSGTPGLEVAGSGFAGMAAISRFDNNREHGFIHKEINLIKPYF